MGECSNPRCLQEKRYFKRELLSWYKKVPYTLGLELVAENLAGSSSGHIKTLLLPFNDMEPEKSDDFDFDPDPSLCPFCEGKVMEYSADLTAELNLPETPTKVAVDTGVKVSAYNKSRSAVNTDFSNLEGFNSFYSQLAMTSLLYQQQQLQSVAAAAVQALTSSSADHLSSAPGMSQKPDIPLNLSATDNNLSAREHRELRVPEIKSKKKDNSPTSKRSYTDKELNAAVEAIKSGNIGTRRAAQMFGVPRSTLRNKVFKSGDMNRRLSDGRKLVNSSAVNSTSATAIEDSDKIEDNKSEASANTSPPKSPSTSSPSYFSTDRNQRAADSMPYNLGLSKQLEELRSKYNMTDQFNTAEATATSNSNRLLNEMFNPLQFNPAAYQFMLPNYAALAALPGYEYLNPYAASSLMMPYLPDLVKNLTQKRLELEQLQASALTDNPRQSTSGSSKSMPDKCSKKSKEDNIVIPEYKPSVGPTVNGAHAELSDNLMASEALKSMLNKNGLGLAGFGSSSYLQNVLPFQQPTNSIQRSVVTKNNHIPSGSKRSSQSLDKPLDTQTSLHHSAHKESSSNGKKRPKRGQYRKYDSELLAQAVRAVQRGEMSVHRAGTFYGVPHSTLEYKVKERHLLRKKKIAENSENKNKSSAATVSSYSSDSSQSEKYSNSFCNTDSSSIKEEGTGVTSPKSTSTTLTNNSNTNNTSSLFDFSNNHFPELTTPASELLKKLHERAQKKAADILNGRSGQHLELQQQITTDSSDSINRVDHA